MNVLRERVRGTIGWVRLRQPSLVLIAIGFIGLGVLSASLVVHAPDSQRIGPLSGYRIIVDPGHGGIDTGCRYADTFEKDINLKVAIAVKKGLESKGAQVFMTRAKDIDLGDLFPNERTRHRRDLGARVDIGIKSGGDLYLSIHANTAASGHLQGAMTFYPRDNADARRLASSIQAELTPIVPGNQNGILPGRFYILRRLQIPSVLIEVGFLSNSQDRRVLQSTEGRKRIAEAIVAGTIHHVMVPPEPGDPALSLPAPSSPDSEWFDDVCEGEW